MRHYYERDAMLNVDTCCVSRILASTIEGRVIRLLVIGFIYLFNFIYLSYYFVFFMGTCSG